MPHGGENRNHKKTTKKKKKNEQHIFEQKPIDHLYSKLFIIPTSPFATSFRYFSSIVELIAKYVGFFWV